MELLSLVMLTLLVRGVWGGCRNGGPYGDSLCCQGKDLSCRTDGYIQGQRYYTQCYCDSACVENEDCCSDYESSCPSKSNDIICNSVPQCRVINFQLSA